MPGSGNLEQDRRAFPARSRGADGYRGCDRFHASDRRHVRVDGLVIRPVRSGAGLMSGNEWRNLSVAIPAKESRAQAAAWLERRHREDWNAQEQKKLDAWLTASPAHMVAYVRVETAWKRADRLSVLRNLEASQPRLPNLKHARPFLAALAGVLAIVAVVGYLVVPKFLRSDEVVYATGVGGHRAIVLADGTRIELNTQTTLRMKTDHGARVAWLDQGEAYFKIAHDARHPFIVFVDDRRVTDLGTRFVIRRNPADLRVALLEGRALF